MNRAKLTPTIAAISTSSSRPQSYGAALDRVEMDVAWDEESSATDLRNMCVVRVLESVNAISLLKNKHLIVITGAQCLGDNPETQQYYPRDPRRFVQNLLPETNVDSLVVSHACASTGIAIGMAADLCSSGAADAVLVCSSTVDGPLEEDTFRDTRAWADEVRPFDIAASGTRAHGFAGAVLIRGSHHPNEADIAVRSWYARSIGGKANSDTDEELSVMSGAVDRGRIVPTLIMAHATGTRQGDAAELEAIENFSRKYKSSFEVLTNKGAVGHGVFAAGIASVATAARALQGVEVYGSYGLRNPVRKIPNVSFIKETVSNQPIDIKKHKSALVNCFGFSGSNVALILERI